MAESSGDPKGSWLDWMTPRRAWEFVKNVASLEQSVSTLREENRDLRLQIARLQQQIIEQNAQLNLLTGFVRDSLNSRLEAKLEQLAKQIAARKNKK